MYTCEVSDSLNKNGKLTALSGFNKNTVLELLHG
jgi:hypothetical protein